MFRQSCGFLIFVLLLFIHPIAAQEELPNSPEILWDTWGVPHIFSPDNEGLFYAFGWAQAHNHGDLILRLYGEARGRAAEYWGTDYLEGDITRQTLDIYEQGIQAYNAQSDEWRGYMDAFAQGINDYVAAHPDFIDDNVEVVLPIDGIDIMAHGIRVLRYEFLARQGVGILRDWQQADTEFGSNAWAISPSKSASGNAMLVANPHQPWQGFGLWIEAHLVSPDIQVYGAALVGNPVLGIAFNNHLGWTHTVNTHDGWDIYELTLSEDGNHYLFGGEFIPFDIREATVRVLGEGGELSDIPLTIRESIHGTVLAELDNGFAYALRVVGDEAYFAAKEWWDMGRAQNLEEFEAVLARLQIPMFTVMYADTEGNILHLFNELVPIRESGDWSTWSNTTLLDRSFPAITPGDNPDYVWTEYHPYEDLPRVLNPESGWLQNANEPPWTTTYPLALDPVDYPSYMAPPAYVWPRPQSSLRLMLADDSITFEELVEYKHSTDVEITHHLLDDLILAARQSENEILGQAADILSTWDRTADADSVGSVLFTLWILAYFDELGAHVYAEPWDINDPLNTPSGLADTDIALQKLEEVATQLEALRILGGGMDVAYGDVFRLRVGEYDLPANGGIDLLGTFRVLTFEQDDDLRFRPVHGDSYIAVVEFSDPIRAEVLLSYGNATQAHSPHIGDQLPLFAEKELRPAWLTREDIEANLEAHEIFD